MSREQFVVGPSRKPEFWAAVARHGKAEGKTSKAKAKAEVAHPKQDAVRSEPYRRLVALQPCRNCHIQGWSQAAHPPPSGKAIKEDDLDCFALCTTRPGPKGAVEGCHPKFDSYQLFPHDKAVKKAKQWAAETRADIFAADLMPKKLIKLAKERK